MTQHNAALVEETNAAIEQTESQAVELDNIVETFVIDAANDGGHRPHSAALGGRRLAPPRQQGLGQCRAQGERLGRRLALALVKQRDGFLDPSRPRFL